MAGLKPETWLLILVTLGNVLLAVDQWVHHRHAREHDLGERISGKPSLQTQLDTMEALRLERAARVAEELAHLYETSAKHGAQIEELFRLMNRRRQTREGA